MAAGSPEPGVGLTIDTHAHVSMVEFDADRDQVIQRARLAGVSFVEVGFDAASSAKALSLARTLGGKCAVGIHPHNVPVSRHELGEAWKQVEALLHEGNPEIVAIGEIGLDFSRDPSGKNLQSECFSMGLNLARQRRLPVVVHERDAEALAIALVKECGLSQPVIFHCFTGGPEYARRCFDLGGYLGFGGILTYPRNGALREVLKCLPRERILLETDSPYLAPQSRRGRRNEPSFVPEVRSRVAALLETTEAALAETTTANASAAFLAQLAFAPR